MFASTFLLPWVVLATAAGDAPPAARSGLSIHVHFDRNGRAARERVVSGGALARLLHDLAQLLLGSVALDLEGDANLLVAVADGIRNPQDSQQIDVPLHRRF